MMKVIILDTKNTCLPGQNGCGRGRPLHLKLTFSIEIQYPRFGVILKSQPKFSLDLETAISAMWYAQRERSKSERLDGLSN
jgi:hypothetical protein